MEDLKQIIAKNITDLRREQHLTQAELAERLNYSDKAISKWERGESIPDIAVLKQIADLFSVKVDYLINEDHGDASDVIVKEVTPRTQRRRLAVSLLAVALVWLIATVVFVFLSLALPGVRGLWLTFIYAMPVTCIVGIVFNSLWGRRRMNYVIISVLVWSLLAGLFFSIPVPGIWRIFLLGIPAEIIILLWSRLAK